jgi:hypothetical protein
MRAGALQRLAGELKQFLRPLLHKDDSNRRLFSRRVAWAR